MPEASWGGAVSNGGTATILNLGANVVVAHGLPAIPTRIKVTGTQAEVSAPWVTAVDATNFTINVAAPVTANRDLYWEATI